MDAASHAQITLLFPLWYAPAANHGSFVHHLGPNLCFHEYDYRDSLQARLTEGIGQ